MIRILKPSLDDELFEGNPILRGVIYPQDLGKLKIDKSYQREFLSSSVRREITKALDAKRRLPDLELAMRGENCDFDQVAKEILRLHDPVYIVDGQQRRGTLLEYIERYPRADIRQGVIVHFNSSLEWESERFEALNTRRTKVASAVIIRNMRNKNEAIATMYGLSMSDRNFALYDRVCWQQAPCAGHLINAVAFLACSVTLHSHLGPARASNLKFRATGADRIAARIGLPMFRQNLMTFWDAIDGIWGVRNLQRRGAVHMKTGFLSALIDVMWRHLDFWNNDVELVIPSHIKSKLKLFNINDIEVVRLAGAAGMARVSLEHLLLRWINSGRRTHHLTPRTIEDQISEAELEPEVDDLHMDEDVMPMAARSYS
jgi:hypothetical protein